MWHHLSFCCRFLLLCDTFCIFNFIIHLLDQKNYIIHFRFHWFTHTFQSLSLLGSNPNLVTLSDSFPSWSPLAAPHLPVVASTTLIFPFVASRLPLSTSCDVCSSPSLLALHPVSPSLLAGCRYFLIETDTRFQSSHCRSELITVMGFTAPVSELHAWICPFLSSSY